MRVLEERGPLAETQVGGDEGRTLLVTLLQKGEEQTDLGGFGLGVPDLVNQEQVVFDIAADDLVLGTVGLGAVQFIEQIGYAPCRCRRSWRRWKPLPIPATRPSGARRGESCP